MPNHRLEKTISIVGANGVATYLCPYCFKIVKDYLPHEYDDVTDGIPQECPHCGRHIMKRYSTRTK